MLDSGQGYIRHATLCYVPINRGGPVYLYKQLAAELRDQIQSGQLPSQSRIPSLVDLCDEYDMAPMTVRHAIRVLVDEGLLITSPGRGTFVA